MPGEKGLGRLYYFSDLLSFNGFDVDLITADFQHWEKEYRTEDRMREAKAAAPFHITFLHELPYTRNVEPKRILSYRLLAKNAAKYLASRDFDLVYALIPDNHLAATAGRYAKSRGIPFVIDVEDLWPEAMRMVFDVPLISDVLLSYFSMEAKKAYTMADGVIGSSDEYRDEPLKYGVDVPVKKTVYVGNDLSLFDRSVAENAAGIHKPEGEFWVSYAGTIGTSYDLFTFVEAAGILAAKGIDSIKYMILGDGPQRTELEAAAKKSGADVRFPGFLPFSEMACYLSESDITLNSLVEKAPQSIVSKIGDYLAAGKPMINTGLNREFCAKVETDGFGVNVRPGDAAALADAILALFNSPETRKAMGEKARQIAETQFDRPKTYLGIIEMIRSLL
jgi:glycosyltransferase involved in cell wall biosynthesis